MKYRDAKNLHNGDQVIRKEDGVPLIVIDIQVYGQYKKVIINCTDEHGARSSHYNDEVE